MGHGPAPISTGLAATVLTDSAANFTLGGPDNNLAGRILIPDISKLDKAYTITANTKTGITVSGDMLADGIQTGAHYRIELSTPAADRSDEVYIDCYLDEIDGNEDPELKHTLGMQIETQRRLKLIQNVFVSEGGTAPASYTDSDSNQHCTLKLATIQRYAGQAAINTGDITDNRPVLGGDFWNLWQEVIAVKNELIAARGVMPSLDARLDVSMAENGELPEVVAARGSKPTLDSRLDVSIAGDGNLPEVVEARGTMPSLDDRLDVSMAENGELPEIVEARGTTPSLDNRLSVELNADGTLKVMNDLLKVNDIYIVSNEITIFTLSSYPTGWTIWDISANIPVNYRYAIISIEIQQESPDAADNTQIWIRPNGTAGNGLLAAALRSAGADDRTGTANQCWMPVGSNRKIEYRFVIPPSLPNSKVFFRLQGYAR